MQKAEPVFRRPTKAPPHPKDRFRRRRDPLAFQKRDSLPHPLDQKKNKVFTISGNFSQQNGIKGIVIQSGQKEKVLVIGGGPAGLAAAIAASQRGFDVTVADGCAPPVEKACGEGLLPAALGALKRLGVKLTPADGRPFRGISFIEGDMKISANFPDGAAVGLRRFILHERLVTRAQECGVKLLWNAPVSVSGPGMICIRGERFDAQWIIGADGRGSLVRRASGLERFRTNHARFANRRHYRVEPWSEYTEVHWGKRAQAYITPVGKEELCVVLLANRPENANFETGLAEFPDLQRRLSRRPLLSRERGAVTAMRSLMRVQRGTVALVGDAAGGVDAITGDGLRLAFEQAIGLADAMRNGDLEEYERLHRRLMRRPRHMAGLLLWLGRHERIRKRAFRAMGNRPDIFARLLEMHVGRGTAGKWLAAGASLGWQLLAW